jgi:hypothetical protein
MTDFRVQAPAWAPDDEPVDIGGGRAMHERVSVPIVWGRRLVTFHLRVVSEIVATPRADRFGEAEIVVEQIAIRDQEAGVFGGTLREVPFDAMREAAIERAVFQFAEPRTSPGPLPVRRRRPKQTMTPLALARAARVYVEAESNPTAAVQKVLGMSASTAAEWVRRARSDGLLTPTAKGRPGGELTPWARELLKQDEEEKD